MFQSPSLRGSGRFRIGPGASSNSLRFQSPSLRGSGRFAKAEVEARKEATFQSPSLRGSGRFRGAPLPAVRALPVSIPFIAGQWSLRRSGAKRIDVSTSFNPLHCGAVVASGSLPDSAEAVSRVSIPFIAGQWSLRMTLRPRRCSRRWGFNPLHCGAVVASRLPPSRRVASAPPVSIPFIAGQWSLPYGGRGRRREPVRFQSPSLRGSGRFIQRFRTL